MSIAGALSNALSGLTASARAAQTVSDNLSNAITEGYGRRELALSANTLSSQGGVRTLGVTRAVEPGLLGERRIADADFGGADARNAYFSRLQNLVGTPDEPSSLSGRLSEFDASLVTAASRPDSTQRLQGIVNAANGVAGELNRISDGLQSLRRESEAQIDTQITRLNDALASVQDLNRQISRAIAQGQDTVALEDLRQQTIDGISDLVPVRQVDRDRGQVALYTTTGAALLDGRPAEIEFSPSPFVTAEATVGNGQLSAVTFNGRPVDFSAPFAPLAGGRLATEFEIRDNLAPAAQSQIDAIARDLVERFQDPAVDPSLAPTDAGLFTDGGSAFDPVNELGLAGRLSLNALADPQQGGDLWRLRDGLQAAAPGDVGNATLLQAFSDALSAPRVASSGSFGVTARGGTELGAVFSAEVALSLDQSEGALGFANVTRGELQQLERRNGVDSDAEMQRLLLIEQMYAANARMIQVADDMLDTLTRI